MSAAHDVVVIGAGPNGLTAAARLAKSGRKVLLLERGESCGGTAAPDEFHEGFRGPGLHHDSRGVSLDAVRELGLLEKGLELRPAAPEVLGVDSGLLLPGEVPELSEILDPVRPLLRELLLGAPVDLIDPPTGVEGLELLRRAVKLRRLGADRMMELLRLPPMPVADFLGEWIESDELKALVALPAVAGSFAGPRSPGTTLNLLRLEALNGPGVVGGGPAVVASLERAARENGVEIRTSATVETIRAEGGRVTGVLLEGGETIDAAIVAAACSSKHALLELLPSGAISSRLSDRISAFRTRGTTAQLLLALERAPRFEKAPAGEVEHARTGSGLDDPERAFDAIKYGRVAPEPMLDLWLASASNPGLAPQGAALLSILVHFAPQQTENGWNGADREQLTERVLEMLERRSPGLRSSVLAHDLRTPPDLEKRYGLSGGQIHHGEHAMDQLLVRPAPECARYATPVEGLFLCGSGSHPGGGLTLLPGFLGAAAILAQRRR